MPGSIQVSVLGLMDLAVPHPLSSLSLTVAMGKREYRTVGGGELSLPVVSLRENLIVMVHDAEGEEMLRTEFRTLMLLERRLWDDLFPLMNGGSIHMKLQFLLSEQDRKRIREMRDSALKKRHMEKPSTRHRRSFSDNRIGYSPKRTVTENVTEGMLLDHSEPADPIVEPSFGQSEKFPACKIGMGGFPRSAVIGEGDTSNLNFPQTMSKSFSAGMLSEINSQEKSKHVKESFLLKKDMQNVIPTIDYETLGNKDLKCDEKIYKLDIDTEVIKEIKNKNSDGASPDSAKSGSSMTIDNGSKTIGSGRSTSLTEGTSSERKDFASVDVDKGPSVIPLIRNFETVREKENLNLMLKGGGSSGSNATSGAFKARPSSHDGVELRTADAEHITARKKHNIRNKAGEGNAASSKGVNRKIDTLNIKENNNEERKLGDKSLPLKKMLNHLGKIEHPFQQGSFGEVARTVGDENMLRSHPDEQTASAEHSEAGKKNNGRIWYGHGDATSGVNRKVDTIDVNENNNEEQNLKDKSLPLKKMIDEPEMIKHSYQQGTYVEVTKAVNDENILQSPSNEQAAPGSSYEKAEALESGYSLVCPIEILDAWPPRHLCITTGSKLLRYFAESFTVTSETNPIESSSMSEDDTKQQKDGDANQQGNENKVLRSSGNSCIENSPSSSKSNGRLIEQGVRLVVVIVACGLLLKAV